MNAPAVNDNTPVIKITPTETMKSLAASLKDVIEATTEAYLEIDPEEAYMDLACRLVTQLSLKQVAVIPAERFVEANRASGAERTFDILTRWMRKGHRPLLTRMAGPLDPNPGKSLLILPDPDGAPARSFHGESIQDAYAQAAQTIVAEEGIL